MKSKSLLIASISLNVLLIGTAGYFWLGRSGPANLPPSLADAKSPTPGLAASAPAVPAAVPFSFPARAAAPAPSSPPSSVATATPVTAPVIAFSGRVAPGPTAAANPASSADAAASSGVPVDAAAPGNSLHFRGMRVAVAENLGTGPAGQPGLAVDVTPEAPGGESATTAQGDEASAPASDNETASRPDVVSADQSSADRRASAARASGSSAPPADEPTASAPSKTAAVDQTSEKPPRSRLQVFTPEELLFRTKWGWAAFDLMRREAAAEAANRQAAAD